MAGKGNATRKNLMHYTPELLVEFQAITTSGTVICTPCTPSWAHHPRGSCSPCSMCSKASSRTSSW